MAVCVCVRWCWCLCQSNHEMCMYSLLCAFSLLNNTTSVFNGGQLALDTSTTLAKALLHAQTFLFTYIYDCRRQVFLFFFLSIVSIFCFCFSFFRSIQSTYLSIYVSFLLSFLLLFLSLLMSFFVSFLNVVFFFVTILLGLLQKGTVLLPERARSHEKGLVLCGFRTGSGS